MTVEIAGCHAVGLGRDHGLRARLFDHGDQRIGIESLVGDDRAGCHAFNQLAGLRQVVRLSGGQRPARQLPQPFDDAVNLGRQPAARATERLVAFFLGAPAACWWARTMVESRKTSSKSASIASSAKTRCQMPRSDQRANRLYALFQDPNDFGRSRQGAPVRATHSTASTNKRLFLAVTPQSLAFPDSIASMRRYWSSRSIKRGIFPAPSMSWRDSLNLIVNRL